MAFYEMLPGAGMPPGLQAGMDSVLNKKFGTSTTYPAEGWPDTVNLMGLLEEKTVSGAIATFTDGADEVPLKSWEVEIAPTLTGKSAIEATVTGKNLLPDKTYQRNDNTLRIGTDTLDGTLNIKAGTYTLSVKTVKSGSFFYTINGTTTGITTSGDGDYRKGSFTLSADSELFFHIYNNSGITSADVSELQLEAGSSRTTYEPYTAPTVSTVNLGRTIYGGSVDVVNGSGESKNGLVTDFSTLRANGTSTSGAYRYIMDVSGMGDYNVGACISNILTYRVAWNADVGEFYNTANVLVIFLSQDNATDAINYLTSNSCKVAYPLATPETFIFDPVPIDSKLGANTLWSEQGSSAEVTYRSQGTTTPILPTLVTKTITENGTYSAEDDNADGYSEVTVNVESIVKIGINSGKLNISDGTITADSAWCYTDPFDCPSGIITMDFGESDINVGIELVYSSDNSHANYWTCGNGLRYREVDISSYYSPTKKARLSFKKQYLSKVLLMDFGNGKIYSSLNASQFEEAQANLLSTNNAQSEGSEEE